MFTCSWVVLVLQIILQFFIIILMQKSMNIKSSITLQPTIFTLPITFYCCKKLWKLCGSKLFLCESANRRSVQTDKRIFFLFKKSSILKWSSRWRVVSGINDYITTQKTKKQDWIETKRHIVKEAKETFFMICGSRRRKKKVEEDRGVAWRQLQRKHVDDDGNASKRYFYIWKPFCFSGLCPVWNFRRKSNMFSSVGRFLNQHKT